VVTFEDVSYFGMFFFVLKYVNERKVIVRLTIITSVQLQFLIFSLEMQILS